MVDSRNGRAMRNGGHDDGTAREGQIRIILSYGRATIQDGHDAGFPGKGGQAGAVRLWFCEVGQFRRNYLIPLSADREAGVPS